MTSVWGGDERNSSLIEMHKYRKVESVASKQQVAKHKRGNSTREATHW